VKSNLLDEASLIIKIYKQMNIIKTITICVTICVYKLEGENPKPRDEESWKRKKNLSPYNIKYA